VRLSGALPDSHAALLDAIAARVRDDARFEALLLAGPHAAAAAGSSVASQSSSEPSFTPSNRKVLR